MRRFRFAVQCILNVTCSYLYVGGFTTALTSSCLHACSFSVFRLFKALPPPPYQPALSFHFLADTSDSPIFTRTAPPTNKSSHLTHHISPPKPPSSQQSNTP
jgi:hypothetical protein